MSGIGRKECVPLGAKVNWGQNQRTTKRETRNQKLADSTDGLSFCSLVSPEKWPY